MFPKYEWYEAIKLRHSRRVFQSRDIPDPVVSTLKQLCVDFRFPEARAEMVLDNSGEIFKGAIGSYGKIKGSLAYIAFIGNTGYKHFHEKVGYLGEGIVLEATNRGLSTCWVGGFFRPEVVAEHIQVSPGEKVLAVTPVGYTGQDYTFEEKLMSGMAKSKNRKELSELTEGLAPGSWPAWAEQALKAARLAPSAVNRQPWRFQVEAGKITVMVDSLKDTYHIPKKLDCGIAMLHLELGAMAAGVTGNWQYLDGQEVALFTVENSDRYQIK